MAEYQHGVDSQDGSIIGVYSKGKGSFGFVDMDNRPKGYFVFGGNTRDALSGDTVRAKIKTFKGREEAVITEVLERRKAPITGIFEHNKGKKFGFVVPKNPEFQKDIFIPKRFSHGARNGDMVAVEVTGWNGKSPEGKIVQVIGDPDERGVDILAIAVENGARMGWDDEIREELKQFSAPTEEDMKKRHDFRDEFTITIDGADSKDLDDAISVEFITPPSPLQEGGPKEKSPHYKLSVHIADVTHYVNEKGAIDTEALKRGTSIYLVDKVIPMLPEELSNGLCSLNPHEPKLSMTCEMIINSAGHITETKIYESVIESDFRMTYKEVDEILNEELSIGADLMFGGKVTKQLIDMLKHSRDLQRILTKYKKSLGVLGFNFPEPKIEVDEKGWPIEYKKYPLRESNKIIEEFMISANEAVAREMSQYPFVYRAHEAPDVEDLSKLHKVVSQFGYTLENIRKISPKDVANLLEQIAGDPKEKLLGKMALRSLKKANYSTELIGHFGLALQYYSHFTSPIRRYPDLQIHRIIKEKIHKKLSPSRKDYYKKILGPICEQNSASEVAAQDLEYKIWDLMAAKYMSDKIGQEFEGVISGVMQGGFFVELDNTIEGHIALDSLGGRFEYFEETMELKGAGTKFQIGDRVKVQLVNVNMDRYQIDFELMEKLEE
ncbi:ribonuclease R [Candidatus Gracilibacteria bacterium]|nr:ribonuclease R [Candidatus Gracilibacteria bacterium]